jgi:NAD-dependent DNA ligase
MWFRKQVATNNNGRTSYRFLTGTRDKQVIEILKNAGAIQGASVSKNTFLVVAKSADDDTGKAEDARKLGIQILSVDQFINKYK